MFIEVFVVNAATKAPSPPSVVDDAKLTIFDTFNNQMEQKTAESPIKKFGTLVFTYKIPKGAKTGDYQVKVESSEFPTSFRKFRIFRNLTPPEVFVAFDFDSKYYFPGDKVKAQVKVQRGQGDGKLPPAGSWLAFDA